MNSSRSAPILIVHQGALGDVLLSLPALYALRKYHKENPWTLVGNPQNLSLLHNRGYGQDVLSGHDRRWAGLLQKEGDVSVPFRSLLSTFDRAYLFSRSNPEEWIQGLGRGGLKEAVWVPSFPDEQNRLPLQTLQRRMLKAHSIPWEEREPALFLTDEDRLQGSRCLKALNIPEKGRPVWAIHPGSGSPHKNWPLARFIELARLIEDRKQGQPLFLLGPVEEEFRDHTAALLRETGFPVIKGLPLPVLAGLLTHCSGYVGNDSGISHLAAALGLSSVVLFGPTDPLLWAPQGRAVRILFSSRPCSPCPPETRPYCTDKACLKDLLVEQVMETMTGTTHFQ